MTVDDFDPVMLLWQATEHVGFGGSHEDFSRFLERNPGMSPVACIEDSIVGAIQCGDDGRRGYLYHVAVDRRFRGVGIAESMVSWCVERLVARGIGRCSIHLYIDNHAGSRFWRRIGWRERTDLKVMAFDP